MKILEIYGYFFMVGLGFTGLNLLILAINLMVYRAFQKLYSEYFKAQDIRARGIEGKCSGGYNPAPLGVSKPPPPPAPPNKVSPADIGKEWPSEYKSAREGLMCPKGHGWLGLSKDKAGNFVLKCLTCEYERPHEYERPLDGAICPECKGSMCSLQFQYIELCKNVFPCFHCSSYCRSCNGTGKAA